MQPADDNIPNIEDDPDYATPEHFTEWCRGMVTLLLRLSPDLSEHVREGLADQMEHYHDKIGHANLFLETGQHWLNITDHQRKQLKIVIEDGFAAVERAKLLLGMDTSADDWGHPGTILGVSN